MKVSECINKACRLCRLSHTACDGNRPCRRCTALGKPELCRDVEPKKRGRPPKHFPANTSESGWRMTKKQKSEANTSDSPSPDSSPSHSPRSSCADLNLQSDNERGADGKMLKELLEELRGTKQELKSEISTFYQTVERRLAQTEEKMNSIISMLPSSSSAGARHGILPITQSLSAQMRADLIRQLPFLSDYNLGSVQSQPLVVDDLSKPILAQRLAEYTGRIEDMLPPTIVWANESFCSLVKAPLYELLGRQGQEDSRAAEILLPYMINRSSGLTSDIIYLAQKWNMKDGRALTLRTKYQVFYNKSGWAKWLLAVVEGSEEEQIGHHHHHHHHHHHDHHQQHHHCSPPVPTTTTTPYSYPAQPPHPFAGISEHPDMPGDKEPFSFSAFPSCFSSLPFSLPPRLHSEPGPQGTPLDPSTQPFASYDGRDVSVAHSNSADRRTGDTSGTKPQQARGEAEMDELLSALISPNPYPPPIPSSSSWEWDGDWGEGRRAGH